MRLPRGILDVKKMLLFHMVSWALFLKIVFS
ncbi:hypothetical protein RIR_e5023_jg27932.t1 [Rhizophagus irregularis DAOM 181602=DAOM 197198]|nr:hypothetical protein RIR_e5023_jg27932.t1 [Rhizophagus irregularis DAOM 181602=DAOM 197198]